MLRECGQLFAKRGPYAASREELTPVAIDWMSFVPPTVTALWLLATPSAAHTLPKKGWGAQLLTPQSIRSDQDHGCRKVSVPAINVSGRLILPGLGVVVFLFAYLAQNVWQIFHIDDVTRAIQSLDQVGLVIGIAILGFIEATIVLCFYVPGTAVLIVLLLGMQPGWAQALPLVAGLTVGTMVGYGASLVLGRVLQQRLPSLVGEAYFHKAQSLIERYGLLAFVAGRLSSQPARDRLWDPGIFSGRAGVALLCRCRRRTIGLVGALCVRRRPHREPESCVEQQFPALCRRAVSCLVAVRIVFAAPAARSAMNVTRHDLAGRSSAD